MPLKTVSTLADMLSDGSDVDMIDARDENAAPHKKAAKAPAKKARKTKPASKRLSGGKKRAVSKTTQRPPLTERSNDQQREEDTEEVDEFAEEQPDPDQTAEQDAAAKEQEAELGEPKAVTKKRGRPAKKAISQTATAKERTRAEEGDVESAPTNPRNRPVGSRVTSAAVKRAAKARSHPEPGSEPEAEAEAVIPDSQHVPMDLDKFDLREDQVPQSAYRQGSRMRTDGRQQQPGKPRPAHNRAGSVSDPERGGDPTLRRKLNDMTKKFETLQTRYTRLQEVGIKEAEDNFERLKRQSKAQEEAANTLVASLKAELAAARKDASQNTSLSSQITKAKDLAKANDDKLKASESQLAALTEKVNLAQSETKSLQARLAASRQASNDTSGPTRVPGSAVKGKNATVDRNAAAQAAVAQLKEDLYSDLTGLIVRSVERTGEADVFDCIQTGRNGTLHFRLSIDALDDTASYAETEFQYTPRLDEQRDRDLLEILPDYLVDEITFSRENAAKFYSRIADTLTRKMD